MNKLENAHPTRLKISGVLFAKNVFYNFLGQGLPILVGIVTIPFIIKGLGKDRYGILSLVWVILGYFTLFDIGLGKAVTKITAEIIQSVEYDRFRSVAWTALGLNLVLGLFGGILFALLVPLFVHKVFNIPRALIPEATASFYFLSFSIPLVVMQSAVRGILEAAQRFDLVNIVKVASRSLVFIAPFAAFAAAAKLPMIILVLTIINLLTLAAFFVLTLKCFPQLRVIAFERGIIRYLLSFGGWISISNLVGPLLFSLERFFIASALTMSETTYYAAPYDIVTRIWIIPASFALTMFPAFSTLHAQNKADLGRYYNLSLNYLLLSIGIVSLSGIVFAKIVLRLWLGAEFARASTTIFQVLTLGVLVNSIAYIPFSLLQGIGRADIPAKIHLLELALYGFILWALIKLFGLNGAAYGWAFRVTAEALLLFLATSRICRIRLSTGNLWYAFLLVLIGLATLIGLHLVPARFPIQGIVVVTSLAGFGILTTTFIKREHLSLLRNIRKWTSV